jgi:2'-5' RNA ligase
MRHAVVFEPEGPLRDAVLAWKTRLAARWASAHYVTHPPHCTLWVGQLERPNEADSALEAALARTTSFSSSLEGPFVFENDALADGGTTCAFRIASAASLQRLQRCVADAVAPHLMRAAETEWPEPLRFEPFLSSCRRYGFPFVGEHWIPHITVGTVPRDEGRSFVPTFMETELTGTMAVNGVTLWRVEGDRHTPTQRYALAAA